MLDHQPDIMDGVEMTHIMRVLHRNAYQPRDYVIPDGMTPEAAAQWIRGHGPVVRIVEVDRGNPLNRPAFGHITGD